MYIPSIVAVDYETALTDGTPSTEYYRGDFRAISAAFAWRAESGDIRTLYLEGESEIGVFLERLKASGSRVVVHNFQFEYGVSFYRFPGFEECLTHDTMRLVQVADNGGKLAAYQPQVVTYDDMLDQLEGGAPRPHSTGLSLVSAVSRWLPVEWHDHKAPFHKWLRENAGVKKGHEGQYLTSLPPEMLEAYNVADAIVTLLLFERLTSEFESIAYDYSLDHDLYKSTARMVAKAKGIGARVDTTTLEAYVSQVEAEVAEIEVRFRTHFKAQLEAIESARHGTYVNGVKTEKARERRRQQAPEQFNISSNKQLMQLFVDTLGIQPRFWTKPPMNKGRPRKQEFVPSPSFKSAHLGTYGDGGELLIKRRKRLLVLQQARALLELANHDQRWHFDIRACGTATGRMAGGRA